MYNIVWWYSKSDWRSAASELPTFLPSMPCACRSPLVPMYVMIWCFNSNWHLDASELAAFLPLMPCACH